jgi:hypothetical protein
LAYNEQLAEIYRLISQDIIDSWLLLGEFFIEFQ